MENLLYKCMTKGTKREASEPRHSQNWVFARRGSFRIYDEKIVCGDWIIPFKDIKKLTIYKTKQFFRECQTNRVNGIISRKNEKAKVAFIRTEDRATVETDPSAARSSAGSESGEGVKYFV